MCGAHNTSQQNREKMGEICAFHNAAVREKDIKKSKKRVEKSWGMALDSTGIELAEGRDASTIAQMAKDNPEFSPYVCKGGGLKRLRHKREQNPAGSPLLKSIEATATAKNAFAAKAVAEASETEVLTFFLRTNKLFWEDNFSYSPHIK